MHNDKTLVCIAFYNHKLFRFPAQVLNGSSMSTLENIVCAQLIGGLGNQMFQYAAGRSLSIRKQAEFYLDDGWFRSMGGATPRTCDITRFPALAQSGLFAPAPLIKRLRYAPETRLQTLGRKLLRKEPALSEHYVAEDQTLPPIKTDCLPLPVYLSGYWQSERYFADCADTIKEDFAFPDLACDEARSLARHMLQEDASVSLHVRRGDYVAAPTTAAWHGICGMDYYERAMAFAEQALAAPRYFIFSDDPDWCRAAFAASKRTITVVDVHGGNDAIHDLHLMTLCRHHIIANSSFSWWGAWLSAREGLVVAPQRWFTAPSLAHVNPSPDRWKLV
ncbi:MAG: O-antigen biosynthesis glycosyltransferase WbnK [Desulfovibrio sp.]